MKGLKKLFVVFLLLCVGLGLSACSNEDAEKISSLEGKLAELQASLESLQGALEASKNEQSGALGSLKDEHAAEIAGLKETISSLQGDLADANEANAELKNLLHKFIQSGVLTQELVLLDADGKETSLEALFGEADESGMHTVYSGSTWTVSGKTILSFDGTVVSEQNADLTLDYFWANTYDYNKGWNYEDGVLNAKLPGVYGVALYVDSFSVAGGSYPAQNVYAEDGSIPEQGISVWYAEVNVVKAIELLSSKDANTLELAPGATDQTKLSEGYTEAVYKSSNEAVATVSSTGLITAVSTGDAEISVTAKKDGVTRTTSLAVSVIVKHDSSQVAGGSEGAYIDLSKATFDQKTKILAHMERWLINEGASIPVVNNSSLAVYSDRVNFLNESYVSLMGFGPMYAAPDTGKGAGTEADPAYRTSTSADPSTLNHLNYADSVESDFLSLLAGGLVEIGWKVENGKGTGWEVQASMAKTLPYAVELKDGQWVKVEGANATTLASSWKFDLRTDLKWQTGEAINVDDFIYTYKLALDPKLNMKRANYYYGGSAPIAGAEAYFKQTADAPVSWDSVGIKKVDDYSFVVTYAKALTEWDVEYAWSSFLYSPVHKATWEACLSADGTSTTYGTSMDKYVACGPYKLSYWEKGKEYRFAKNEHFFGWSAEDAEIVMPAYENVSYTIVKDANASLALFEAGKLDVSGVPASAYEKYATDPRVKAAPGATSFRFSVNKATQAELDAQYGAGSWEAKPILQENDFLWALYYGLDRNNVQEITKTSTGFDTYFTSVYSIVSPSTSGLELGTYRDSEWGKKVYEGIFADDYELNSTLNYAPAVATALYTAALDSMIAKGVIAAGTEENPTKISIEVAAFDGTTWESVLAFVCENYNKLFNNTSKYGKTIVFEAVAAPQPGMDVYYVKQMTGQFDLALAGISGGTLDPMGFMECFCDDNRSGLFLNPGLDTHNANILIDLDLDGDGELDGAKYWSFDALYEAYYQKTFVKDGCVAEEPTEEPAA